MVSSEALPGAWRQYSAEREINFATFVRNHIAGPIPTGEVNEPRRERQDNEVRVGECVLREKKVREEVKVRRLEGRWASGVRE